MKKIFSICIVLVMLSAMIAIAVKDAKAVEGSPTGWGWCSTCEQDRGPTHDFTHGA